MTVQNQHLQSVSVKCEEHCFHMPAHTQCKCLHEVSKAEPAQSSIDKPFRLFVTYQELVQQFVYHLVQQCVLVCMSCVDFKLAVKQCSACSMRICCAGSNELPCELPLAATLQVQESTCG